MDSPRRHIHLGTRLEAAEKVRRGERTARATADALGVPESQVARWVESADRPMTIEEVVVAPEARRLTRRAERLVELIARSEATIRALTQQLVGGKRGEQGAD